jgi:hypothetical protein
VIIDYENPYQQTTLAAVKVVWFSKRPFRLRGLFDQHGSLQIKTYLIFSPGVVATNAYQ